MSTKIHCDKLTYIIYDNKTMNDHNSRYQIEKQKNYFTRLHSKMQYGLMKTRSIILYSFIIVLYEYSHYF